MGQEKDGGDRRGFFKEVLRRYVAPAADFVEEGLEAVKPKPKPLLRPPGALPEAAFVETCQRCGVCGDVCPANAIVYLNQEEEGLNGTPCIRPSQQPCVVCDDLSCMAECPSGALQNIPVDQIRIGLAVVSEGTCVRSKGEDCTACVDLCPLGSEAICLDDQKKVAVLNGCIGCGVCEHVCPTLPKAIVIERRDET